MITDRCQELCKGGGCGGGTGRTSAVINMISLDRLVIRARTRTKPGLPERRKSRGRYRPTAYLTIVFDFTRMLVNVRSAKDTQVAL